MRIACYDKDLLNDDLIGEVTLPIESICTKSLSLETFSLFYKTKKAADISIETSSLGCKPQRISLILSLLRINPWNKSPRHRWLRQGNSFSRLLLSQSPRSRQHSSNLPKTSPQQTSPIAGPQSLSLSLPLTCKISATPSHPYSHHGMRKW